MHIETCGKGSRAAKETPVEQLQHISDVLRHVGLEPNKALPFDISEIDNLLNVRLHPFPGSEGPQIFTDETLSSRAFYLSHVLMLIVADLARANVVKVCAQTFNVVQYADPEQGEFWLNGNLTEATTENLSPWLERVIARDDAAKDGKLINYPLSPHLSAGECQEYPSHMPRYRSELLWSRESEHIRPRSDLPCYTSTYS